MFFPDGRKAGIEWSNASLAELAEDGVIQDEYGVTFTAGKLSTVQLHLPSFLGMQFLSWRRVFSEIPCDPGECIISHPEKST